MFIPCVLGSRRNQSAVWGLTPARALPMGLAGQSWGPRPCVGSGGGPAGEASVLSPQRTCWSPTRTRRPSSCPARASRWTWRRTARTTASTSTFSTCATSCGACGASPVPLGAPPSPRPWRYHRFRSGSEAPALRVGWARGPLVSLQDRSVRLSGLSPPGPAPLLPGGAPRGPELPGGCQGPSAPSSLGRTGSSRAAAPGWAPAHGLLPAHASGHPAPAPQPRRPPAWRPPGEGAPRREEARTRRPPGDDTGR